MFAVCARWVLPSVIFVMCGRALPLDVGVILGGPAVDTREALASQSVRASSLRDFLRSASQIYLLSLRKMLRKAESASIVVEATLGASAPHELQEGDPRSWQSARTGSRCAATEAKTAIRTSAAYFAS